MTHNAPKKAHQSDSPGLAAPDGTREHPAASETPQDAREVERRERWAVAVGFLPWADIDSDDRLIVDRAIALANREQAPLAAERDALQRDLTQAVGERDRLRAGIEALAESWRYKGEFGWGPWQEGHGPSPDGDVLNSASADLRRLLATPDADAQDEGVRRGK